MYNQTVQEGNVAGKKLQVCKLVWLSITINGRVIRMHLEIVLLIKNGYCPTPEGYQGKKAVDRKRQYVLRKWWMEIMRNESAASLKD